MSQGPIPAAIAIKVGGGYGLAKLDVNGALVVAQAGPDVDVTPVQNSSGDVAAAAAVATLAAAAGKTTYITGFSVTGGGATGASVVQVVVSGLLGGSQTYNVPVPAGVTLGIVPLKVDFETPLPASAANTAIVVTCPSLGAGNAHAAANAWGYQL